MGVETNSRLEFGKKKKFESNGVLNLIRKQKKKDVDQNLAKKKDGFEINGVLDLIGE